MSGGLSFGGLARGRKGTGVSDADDLAPLPNSRIVSSVFTRAAEFDHRAAAESGCALLGSLANLVLAHRRLAAARPVWDEPALPWNPIAESAYGVGSDPFADAYDDIQRLMLSIDLEARRVLGPPGADSVPHREGLGAVFGRMAHLYTISFGRFILDGPEGAGRRRLVGEYIAYEALARDLAGGRKHLPLLSDRPSS